MRLRRTFYRQLIAANSQVFGPEHQATLGRKQDLASALESQGKLDEAAKLYREVLASMRKGANPINLSTILIQLAEVLTKAGQQTEATAMLRECLEIREKNLPKGNWRIGTARSLLGGSLVQQGKFAEAEPLVLTGYELLTKAAESPPERLEEAHGRVVELYEKWGKKKQAEEWRKKRTAPKK